MRPSTGCLGSALLLIRKWRAAAGFSEVEPWHGWGQRGGIEDVKPSVNDGHGASTALDLRAHEPSPLRTRHRDEVAPTRQEARVDIDAENGDHTHSLAAGRPKDILARPALEA